MVRHSRLGDQKSTTPGLNVIKAQPNNRLVAQSGHLRLTEWIGTITSKSGNYASPIEYHRSIPLIVRNVKQTSFQLSGRILATAVSL